MRRLLVLICAAASGSLALAADVDAGRVMGGTKTTIRDQPWQVAIKIHILRNQGFDAYCSGSRIYEDWVITAAHCVWKSKAEDVQIRAGADDYTTAGRWIFAEQIIPRGDYNPATHENDIALIKLRSEPNDGISQTIALAGGDLPLNGQMLSVSGWGRQQPGVALRVPELRVAQVPYVDPAVCSRSNGQQITGGLMCAGAPGIDACQGDSGGPLVWHDPKNPKDARLVGVVTSGEGCGGANRFGLYIQLAGYIPWIRDKAEKL